MFLLRRRPHLYARLSMGGGGYYCVLTIPNQDGINVLRAVWLVKVKSDYFANVMLLKPREERMCPYLELSRSLPAPQRPLKPSARLLLQSRSESGRWRHLRPSWSTNQRTKSLGCFSSCSSTAAERAPHPPRTTQRFSSIQKTRFLLLKAGNVLKYLSSGAQTLDAPTVPSG